jgi:peptidoglycan hydrolase-like protein with peptidoglycan-binding domain/3D (Asp-Asp-Asp) domain-containing protein
MRIPKHIFIIVFLIAAIAPLHAKSRIPNEPFDQEFFVTAYYSPKSGQCCYIKGGLKADAILNGQGYKTADGTPVFAGVIAAPPSYPFGTRIQIPGIGVFEVRDRGGAIQELSDGIHRLDIWTGEGEAGLARALSLGGIRTKGRVYPISSLQPDIRFTLEDISPAWERLRTYLVVEIFDIQPQFGDFSLSTLMIQEMLRDLGVFKNEITGLYGHVTRNALREFLRRYHLNDPAYTITKPAIAYLFSALRERGYRTPIPIVGPESPSATVRMAQRAFRYLGYYRGRTDGRYGDVLKQAVLTFQIQNGIVRSALDRGAGRIGPQTLSVFQNEWNKIRVKARADKILFAYNARIRSKTKTKLSIGFLEKGIWGRRFITFR